LDYGLKFIPTLKLLDPQLTIEAQRYITRRISLFDFFQHNPTKEDRNPNYFRKKFTKKSNWTPSTAQLSDHTLKNIDSINEITQNEVNGKLIKHKDQKFITHKCTPNLSDEQVQAIKKLRNDPNIIIKSADKGGAVVIMSKNLYIKEAERQLQNPNYYKSLDHPLYPETAKTLDRQLSNLAAMGYITNKQYNFLRPDFNKMTSRYFYLLPKIHKPITSWPDPHMPAGRPIVSDCGSESSKICEFIDHFLQPVSTKHEFFIKDTYEFISKVWDQIIDPSWLLISADVESLYTNMQIDRILQSIRQVFQEFPDLSRADEAILDLMETTLKNNDFEFNGQFYLQVCGIAMGRKYSPAAANIYLRDFDHKAMHEFEIKPHLYSRFLDDIFAVWPGTRQQLIAYQDYLNSLIPGIKVTFEIREQIISFLDTQVYKTVDQEGHCVLKTKVFFKPTDTHQLLHHSSFHPKHIFLGITKSQFIRFKRISSSFYDYNHSSNTLIKVLTQRGYNRRSLQRLKMQIWNNYSAVPNRDNPEALLKAHKAPEIIPIVTPFDNFHSILNRKWCRVTRKNPVLKEARIIAAYKRHKNLGDLLVRGRLKKPEAHTPAEEPLGSPNPPDSQDSSLDDSQTEALLDALIAAMERHEPT